MLSWCYVHFVVHPTGNMWPKKTPLFITENFTINMNTLYGKKYSIEHDLTICQWIGYIFISLYYTHNVMHIQF